MKPHTAIASTPVVPPDRTASPGDAAQKRAITEALWTEIH